MMLTTLRGRAEDAVTLARIGQRLLSRIEVVRDFRPVVLRKLVQQVLRGGTAGGPMALWRVHALASPEREAIVAGDVRLSYGELDRRTNRLARGLLRLGVGPGDRVGLLLENGHEFFETSTALSYLGATAVQIGYRLKAGEVAHILSHSGAQVLVLHGGHAEVAREAAAHAGRPVTCVVSGAAELAGAVPYEDLASGGDAAAPPAVPGGGYGQQMLYTSGTTGQSKGAKRDLRQTSLLSVLALISELPLYRDDRHLVLCPLYHLAAASFCLFVMGIGGCLVIPPRFDAEAVPGQIAAERITSSVMVPTMMTRLLQVPGFRDFRSLRWLMSVAAPLPTELARQVEARLGPVLYNLYGSTETGLVTLALPGEHTSRPGTIGRAIFGNDIRLLDQSGGQVPQGQVGEIYVRNGTLMTGYHEDLQATAAATRSGYLSVGDLGYRDADGYLYLSDRKTDMVISAGVNIYPLEIEQRLYAHQAVADCAVVGVPDAEWGEALVAFVVAAPGHAPGPVLAEELRRFVGEALAGYKRPRRVEFVPGIPRNLTGKILKRDLRALAVRCAGSALPL